MGAERAFWNFAANSELSLMPVWKGIDVSFSQFVWSYQQYVHSYSASIFDAPPHPFAALHKNANHAHLE